MNSGFFTLTSQEPDQWEPETDDEVGIEQDEEVTLLFSILSSNLPWSRSRLTRQGMLLLLPQLMDKRWELKLNVVTKITVCRILLPRHAPDTGWLWRWSCMTSLLPTRWIFSLSLNLIRLQVGAEVRGSSEDERDEDSEEYETEVL